MASLPYHDLVHFLRSEYYREVDQIQQSADFMVLGDTIIVWPVSAGKAWRLSYFGNDLEKCEIATTMPGKWLPQTEVPEIRSNRLETVHGKINPEEYIVHPHHGVGIYEGQLLRKTIDNEWCEFISLRYAGNDRLFFPWERRMELMPYIGARHPRLTRLHSQAWQRTKERVEVDLIHIARELLTIYAQRQLADRKPYKLAASWEQKISAAVSYQLTEDQDRCLAEIKNDLSQNAFPMDRLLCGDVGFGKTEVAIRAAAHILAAGKQIAIIAPTTVLAEQHYAVLVERLAPLPVHVDHISRLTKSREKDILAGLASGKTDVIVGTHRLLSKDVNFKDLGLLVLDEEQKFGVAQKERLKSVRPTIDVLSLSATPIPRTLSMSLSGLRGLSLLRTPPKGRLSVKTYIQPFTDDVLQKALVTELNRGGQVYVVHNRVQSLGIVEQRVKNLLEQAGFAQARVEMAHGQMDEVKLAKTMTDFLGGKINVLVASSIVEHGLDCPGANTLVVLHSERFGLSDLYQLRGRVGRRNQQAHAYFLLGGIEHVIYADETEAEVVQLTDTARKRLQALKEADELGSGWSIALRDLEIRGAGNILGHEQHGSLEAIGLLLYSQLLQEAIGKQASAMGISLFQNRETI